MMNWKPYSLSLVGLTLLGAPVYAQAKIYISIEQAQQILFPNQKLKQSPIIISHELQEKLRVASSIRHPFEGNRIWSSSDGGWFVVDEVVGKHEMITYAVALNSKGSIIGTEILEYVESYGYEIAEPQWRKQFIGKTAADPIKLNQDIQNISGATLSSKHLTDGVKRVTVLYDLALQNMSAKPK